MKTHFNYSRSFVIRLLFFICFISGLSLKTPANAQADQDAGWPRQFTSNGATLILYQPQVEKWENYKQLDGAAAFALTPKGGKETHGVLSFDATTSVDKEKRLAYLDVIKYPSVRFPTLDASEAAKMETLTTSMLPKTADPISIDLIMADLDKSSAPAPKVAVKNDPPAIFYNNAPAILVIIPGDSAVLAPVSKTDLSFVVNANWDVFYEKSKHQYFLLTDKTWMNAGDLKGPWTATKQLPKDMSKLPSGENFDEVKKMVPPPATSGTAPKVFFSAVPAELILLKGAPVYSKIKGTQLLYITNTDNDVFLDDANKEYYVLLSGRWFSSKDLNGGWVYAGDKLPADFSKIPENSTKSHVLASVPGTIEASDAVMLAQIPTTERINKKEAAAGVKVTYDGTPQFKKIDGTSLDYATNTQDKVIKDGNQYYVCYQAVWFVSSSPSGPWTTCDMIPAEIYKIPPSSPVYNVTYVTQTNVDETYVESSAAAGYFGAFIIGVGVGACIAYGTGWFYPPYIFYPPGMMYPIYRPWPCTYGAGFTYNPWTGGFAGGQRVYGPYGAAGTSAWYNPATGRYGRAASVQTPYGGRTAAHAYNPWTGGNMATAQGHNPYGQWGTSVATRNGNAIQTGHVTNANGTTAGYRTNTGQHGVVHTGANGTISKGTNGTYAGHDGNVYRKNSNGEWSQYTKNGWQSQVGGQGGTQHQNLENAAQNRERGQMQNQRFQQFRQSGGFNRGGMGGGRMGGGGFRRR
ncbi:hypothetical protein [Taibaiella soli]|uniref:Carbohydrate-binding family V/XII n=1 Tax=Taibaiella soli TaxID=1649169 RepID=A0A2W2BMZ7_9BACT|nr:hypothetical protein [Taibaiella soli]PZF74836.1 hypothetical protein DN068_01165 [Taibaiella soli]